MLNLSSKWFFFSFVLPSCLAKHANSNKTTVVHAAESADRLNDDNS
jgi:hypothetical protein